MLDKLPDRWRWGVLDYIGHRLICMANVGAVGPVGFKLVRLVLAVKPQPGVPENCHGPAPPITHNTSHGVGLSTKSFMAP